MCKVCQIPRLENENYQDPRLEVPKDLESVCSWPISKAGSVNYLCKLVPDKLRLLRSDSFPAGILNSEELQVI